MGVGLAMPNQRTRQDDLTRISGIGQRTDAKLKKAGIRTFAQLGRTSVEKLAVISGSSAEQIERKDWVGQARALALVAALPPDRPTFSIELQLDPTSRAVISSSIHHVQSDDRDDWRGWDSGRLVSFIEDRTGPDTQPATDTAVDEDPVAGPEKDHVVQEASPVALAEIRADRPLFPGSGPTIASFNLDRLDAYAISATALDVEVYGQRSPISKSRLLGEARTRVRQEQAITLDIDLRDPAPDSPLEVFAVLTFLDGTEDDSPPVWVELGDAKLTLRSRPSRELD